MQDIFCDCFLKHHDIVAFEKKKARLFVKHVLYSPLNYSEFIYNVNINQPCFAG